MSSAFTSWLTGAFDLHSVWIGPYLSKSDAKVLLPESFGLYSAKKVDFFVSDLNTVLNLYYFLK